MARIPLKGLESFDAVARHLSFSRAAEELFVSQGAVSKQIKSLETFLGAALFTRGRRSRVEFTPTGRALAQSVQPAFSVLMQLTADFRQIDDPNVVTISTVPSLAAHWLIPRLDEFRDRHPNIDIRIQTVMHVVDLQGGDVDVAIRYGRGNWPNTTVLKLSDGVVIPVCAPSMIKEKHKISPNDIRNYALLHNVTRAEWSKWIATFSEPKYYEACDLILEDLNVVIQAAINGQGMALVPRMLVETALMSKLLVTPFDAPLCLETAFYVAYSSDRPARRASNCVIRWLQDHTSATTPMDD